MEPKKEFELPWWGCILVFLVVWGIAIKMDSKNWNQQRHRSLVRECMDHKRDVEGTPPVDSISVIHARWYATCSEELARGDTTAREKSTEDSVAADLERVREILERVEASRASQK